MILNSDSLFWYKGYVFQNCIYYVGFHCNHQVHFMPMCFTTWGLLEGLQYSFICRRKNPMFMLQRNNAALCWWLVDMRHLESAYWWTDEEVLDCYKRKKKNENNKHCVKKVSANASSIILCHSDSVTQWIPNHVINRCAKCCTFISLSFFWIKIKMSHYWKTIENVSRPLFIALSRISNIIYWGCMPPNICSSTAYNTKSWHLCFRWILFI